MFPAHIFKTVLYGNVLKPYTTLRCSCLYKPVNCFHFHNIVCSWNCQFESNSTIQMHRRHSLNNQLIRCQPWTLLLLATSNEDIDLTLSCYGLSTNSAEGTQLLLDKWWVAVAVYRRIISRLRSYLRTHFLPNAQNLASCAMPWHARAALLLDQDKSPTNPSSLSRNGRYLYPVATPLHLGLRDGLPLKLGGCIKSWFVTYDLPSLHKSVQSPMKGS